MQNKPAAEVDIDVELVRALIERQHPDIAGLELVEVASGWDNVIYRLGPELCVRLRRGPVNGADGRFLCRWRFAHSFFVRGDDSPNC